MNKTLTIPDDWGQVAIGQFQEISDIPNDSADNILQTVSILIDIDPEEIRNYSTEEFNAIVSKLDWIKEIPNEANFKQVITVDGTNYALVKFAELTGGEWLDLDEYIKNPIGNLHKIMSVMYRELLGGKVDSLILAPYDTESANERALVFKEKMPVGDCYGALVFFSNIVSECSATIQVYFILLEKMRKVWKKQSQSRMRKWLMKEAIKSGIGMPSFIALQKGTLQKSNQYLN